MAQNQEQIRQRLRSNEIGVALSAAGAVISNAFAATMNNAYSQSYFPQNMSYDFGRHAGEGLFWVGIAVGAIYGVRAWRNYKLLNP